MILHRPLVLASQSPRRRDILGRLGLTFDVRPAGIDEACAPGESPVAYARRMAFEKAQAVAEQVDVLASAVLGADTIVVCEGELLGKPRDEADALRMLGLLSGRWHTVTTAVCVFVGHDVARCDVQTEVRFRVLSRESQRRYVESGEGADKAGGYGIQELGAGLVAEVRGSYTNVVGLPAAETLELLEHAGVLEQWP